MLNFRICKPKICYTPICSVLMDTWRKAQWTGFPLLQTCLKKKEPFICEFSIIIPKGGVLDIFNQSFGAFAKIFILCFMEYKFGLFMLSHMLS